MYKPLSLSLSLGYSVVCICGGQKQPQHETPFHFIVLVHGSSYQVVKAINCLHAFFFLREESLRTFRAISFSIFSALSSTNTLQFCSLCFIDSKQF